MIVKTGCGTDGALHSTSLQCQLCGSSSNHRQDQAVFMWLRWTRIFLLLILDIANCFVLCSSRALICGLFFALWSLPYHQILGLFSFIP